jgi:hemerythrin-like domain-containing protein
MASVVEVLREEHRNIARLLDALEHQIGVFAEGGDPDYDIVRGVADYFGEFPDRCHHPKENVIFARLKAVDPAAASAVGDLVDEHRAVHQRVGQFRQDIDQLLSESDIARDRVVDTASGFIEAERQHMRMEEELFLPLAEQRLTPADWSAIEAALANRADPLFGGKVEAQFKALSERLIAWEEEFR